jgi:5-formyltetrahydrofolate cyclo-ligase
LKNELRRRMLACRREMDELPYERRSRLLSDQLIDLLRSRLVRSPEEGGPQAPWMLYVPAKRRREPDIEPVLRWIWSTGRPLLLPRVKDAGGAMEACLVTAPDQLAPGAFSLLEPAPDIPAYGRPQDIPLMLLPGLAFDGNGYRLGYGGGYYDRFLERLRLLRRAAGMTPDLPELWAASFEFQRVPRVPAEPHDMPVSRLVTEAGVYEFPGG